jgi:hypothetical protein
VSGVLVGSSICASVGPQIATRTKHLFSKSYLFFYAVAAAAAVASALMAFCLRLPETTDESEQKSAHVAAAGHMSGGVSVGSVPVRSAGRASMVSLDTR